MLCWYFVSYINILFIVSLMHGKQALTKKNSSSIIFIFTLALKMLLFSKFSPCIYCAVFIVSVINLFVLKVFWLLNRMSCFTYQFFFIFMSSFLLNMWVKRNEIQRNADWWFSPVSYCFSCFRSSWPVFPVNFYKYSLCLFVWSCYFMMVLSALLFYVYLMLLHLFICLVCLSMLLSLRVFNF